MQERTLGACCGRCGEPVGLESERMAELLQTSSFECASCRANPPLFLQAVAFGSYAHLRPLVHLMKFEGVPTLAKPLGSLLGEAIAKHLFDVPRDMVAVPVPLYRHKRAYNQSTLLAQNALTSLRKVSSHLRITLRPDLLRRIRRTESQFLLTRAQRKVNVRGAFSAAPAVRHRDILLIDDVYTTGATVMECTRVLLAQGARSVRIATLARAVQDDAIPWLPMVAGDHTRTPRGATAHVND